jgi:hypothetical protein
MGSGTTAELVINGVEISPGQVRRGTWRCLRRRPGPEGLVVVLSKLGAVIAVTLLLVYFGILKCCYNSFSLSHVLKEYQERKVLEDVGTA